MGGHELSASKFMTGDIVMTAIHFKFENLEESKNFTSNI